MIFHYYKSTDTYSQTWFNSKHRTSPQICNGMDVTPKLYDGTDPKLRNVRALYELIQFVKGLPNMPQVNAMFVFDSPIFPFVKPSDANPVCTNKLLARDSPHKYNRLTRFGCMYRHLTCVQTDERHRQVRVTKNGKQGTQYHRFLF